MSWLSFFPLGDFLPWRKPESFLLSRCGKGFEWVGCGYPDPSRGKAVIVGHFYRDHDRGKSIPKGGREHDADRLSHNLFYRNHGPNVIEFEVEVEVKNGGYRPQYQKRSAPGAWILKVLWKENLAGPWETEDGPIGKLTTGGGAAITTEVTLKKKSGPESIDRDVPLDPIVGHAGYFRCPCCP